MKTNFLRYFTLFLAVGLIASCNSKNEEGKRIPETAVFASVVNLSSIQKELSWEEIKSTGWYSFIKTSESLPEWTKKVLGTPEESGIKFDDKLILFVDNIAGNKPYLAITGELKNQRDFDQYNKQNSNPGDIKTEGKIRMLPIAKDQVVAWDDNHFIYLSSMINQKPDADSDDKEMKVATMPELQQEIVRLFNLDKKNSLAEEDAFSDLMKNGGDILVYVNGESSMKNQSIPGMEMLNTSIFLKDNRTTFAAKFTNGNIHVQQRQYMSDEMEDFVKKNTGSKIDKTLINKVPAADALAVLAVNIKSDAIQNLLKLMGMDGLANAFLQQAGFSLEDVSKAISGDIVLSVSSAFTNGPVVPLNPDSPSLSSNPRILLAMGVKDEPSFQKIANATKQFLGAGRVESNLSINLDKDLMVVSNAHGYAQEFLQNKTSNAHELISKIEGHPMGGFVDFQKYFQADIARNNMNTEWKTENKNMWKYLTFKGGETKDDAVEIESDIALMDDKTNSLKQLNSFLYKLIQHQKQAASTTSSGRNIDSLLTPPAPDTVSINGNSK